MLGKLQNSRSSKSSSTKSGKSSSTQLSAQRLVLHRTVVAENPHTAFTSPSANKILCNEMETPTQGAPSSKTQGSRNLDVQSSEQVATVRRLVDRLQSTIKIA